MGSYIFLREGCLGRNLLYNRRGIGNRYFRLLGTISIGFGVRLGGRGFGGVPRFEFDSIRDCGGIVKRNVLPLLNELFTFSGEKKVWGTLVFAQNLSLRTG